MNLDAQIKELRTLADRHLRFANDSRQKAAEQQETATSCMRSAALHAREAKDAEQLARGFDLIADALSSGELVVDKPAPSLSSTPLAVAFSEPGAEVLARAHDTAMAAMRAAADRPADCPCCDDSTGGAL